MTATPSVGNQPIDTHALLAAVDCAARGAAEADTDGSIGTATVEALTAAGFVRSFVPVAYGGSGATFASVTSAVAQIGTACASAAWIASLLAYTGRFGAFLPSAGQAELWADGPDSRVVSSMVAAGVQAEQVDGGWNLAGRWLYVSGVEFADWALVSSAPPRPGDRSVIVFAVPRQSFTHDRSWSTVGMNGTGSHTLIIEQAFVPDHRTFVWDDMRLGKPVVPGAVAHHAPLFAVNGLTFAGPILGAARSALAQAEQVLAAPSSGARAAARESARIAYTRAAGEIDAAELLLMRVAATADRGVVEDGLFERSHRDATLAVEMLAQAVDRIFRITGTRGHARSHPMQRIWRDVHAAASHAALQFEPAALAYTQSWVAG